MNWYGDWYGTTPWHQDWYGASDDAALPGYGPPGVASLSLDLLNGYQVTYRWVTDIIKTRSGKEQRISRNDHPKEIYQGSVLLFGDSGAAVRAQLARYAAQGKTFTLGLPHEEMSIRADHAGTTVYVHDTTASDWMNAGQRVICKRLDPDTGEMVAVEGVIQSHTSTSITPDTDPGDAGLIGGSIMPAMAVYLDPEQAFPRYPTEAERWEIRAQAATFDFARTLATLALGPLTTHTGLDLATLTARAAGNEPTFVLDGDAIAGCTLEESGNTITAHCNLTGGISGTTITQLYTALTGSTLVAPTGTWGAGKLTAGDEVTATALDGADDAGPMGTGATVATYDGTPLWDRKLDNDSTITDSIQAMTEILDFDGLPYAIGLADMADWGRSVAYTGTHGDEWQWFKLFMYTVKGRQKAFWLPTWRDDLPFVSKATGTITVEADVGAWWPTQRQHVQIEETSGTITQAEVTAATDNGDGTWTLTIGTTIASSAVEMVSWLELARFASDDLVVTFDEYGWAIDTAAVVVQQ